MKPRYKILWPKTGLTYFYMGLKLDCFLQPVNDNAMIQIGRIIGNHETLLDYYTMSLKATNKI